MKQLLIGTVFVTMLWASVARAEGGAEQQDLSAKQKQIQPAAPILHRRTTLPAGWFKQGGTPGALTGTKVNARPVVHYDTVGPDGTAAGSQDVAERMRRMRSTAVLPEVAADTPPDQPATTTAGSSRRRIPASTGDEVEAKETVSEVGQPATTVVPPNQAMNGVPAPPVTPASPEAGEATGSSSVEAGTAPRADKTSASDIGLPPSTTVATPSGTTNPGQDGAVSEGAGPQANAAMAIPAVEQLPSVMRKPTRRQDMSQSTQANVSVTPERMTLKSEQNSPSDTNVEPFTVDSVPLTPSPLPQMTLADSAEVSTADESEGVLLENQSPVLSVITRGPKTMVVGKAATFVMDLANSSEFAAKDVVVRVNIPQWVEIVQQNPSVGVASVQPDDSGNAVISWSIDRLQGRGQEKLMLDLIPRGSRPLDLGVTWTFSPARTTTQIQVQEPKLHLTVVGPQDVLFGETKIYTITISNPGTGDAENVTLNLLPLVPGEQPAGVRNLGHIPPGGRRTVEVELTTRQTGRLEVRAEATAEGGLLARGQQDVIVRRANLEVAVEGPPMKYAGTRARFEVRVANTGDAPATDVVVVATLPAGARDVASSDGGSLDPNTGQVQWHVGALRPGASRVYELECQLMAPGDNRIDLRSVAAGDLSALGSATTRVESLADLKLTVNDPQGAVAIGADVVYEIRIQNRGTKEAENIQVYGYFSEGVEPVSVGGWRGQLNEGEVILQTIPRIGAGQEMTVRISAQANRPGDHVFRAELECVDPETKLAVEEWTRFYGEPNETRQADQRRPSPGPSTPVKPLKIHRY